MRTITFDEEIYRLVPVEATGDMFRAAGKIDDACFAGGNDHGASDEQIYDAMLAAVPADLPGVVEHSGQPVAYALLDQGCRSPDDCEDYERLAYAGELTPDELQKFESAGRATALFTHPPAQPDTAQSIHYPECWDVAAYPTLESALSEIGAFKCSECNPDTVALKARIAELSIEGAIAHAKEVATLSESGCSDQHRQLAGWLEELVGLRAQLAAQAGQEKTYPACKGKNCGATDGKSHSPECFAEHDACVSMDSNLLEPPAPTNPLAIVQACADEVERTMMFPGGRCESFAHHGVVNAATALRDNPQTIIDAARGK